MRSPRSLFASISLRALMLLAACFATSGRASAVAGDCGASTQDCCTAGSGAGCANIVCCDAVCAVDPFCCLAQWDTACANKALEICEDCRCGDGDCCQPHGGLGCNDASCCDTVCAADAFCCEAEWDGGCALLARSLCGAVCSSDCPLPPHNKVETEECLQELNGS
jgi:hypothetical protein